MMPFLLGNRVDMQTHKCGEYAFFRAVIQGHEQVVCMLAEVGINVDGLPDDMQPPTQTR